MTQILAPKPIRPTGATDVADRVVSGGPARGIALGAALSAPMWLGILYLLREVAASF